MATKLAVIGACGRCGAIQVALGTDGRCRDCTGKRLRAIPRRPLINTQRSQTRRPWTQEEDDVVRRDYRGTQASADELAGRLHRTYFALKARVGLLGVTRHKGPDWSAQEVEYLQENFGRLALATLAYHLPGRSVTAVKIKGQRLGLRRSVREGWFTMLEVCQILGLDHHATQRYRELGILKATRECDRPGSMWRIATQDLRQFIADHAYDLHGRNVQLGPLVDLLLDRML